MEQCCLESFVLETFKNSDHITVKISIRTSIIALIQLQITLILDKVGILQKTLVKCMFPTIFYQGMTIVMNRHKNEC